jgi:hypothetical protein
MQDIFFLIVTTSELFILKIYSARLDSAYVSLLQSLGGLEKFT